MTYVGVPHTRISAQTTDDSISLYSMPDQRFRYIENETFYWINIKSRWYTENNIQAVPMFIFPVPEGEWSCEVSAEGYQATSSLSDPNVGKTDGLIAYSDDQNTGWNIGVNSNCEVTNNKADNSWKYGHPDLEINQCHFKNRQVLERDGDISCHIKTTGPNASVFVVAPAVQKQAKYNYAVSYGAWTDRDMEFGMISFVLDEKDVDSAKKMRPSRRGHDSSSTNYGLMVWPPIPERQPVQQTPDVSVPKSGWEGTSKKENLDELEVIVPRSPRSIDSIEDDLKVPRRVESYVRDFKPSDALLRAWDPNYFDPSPSLETRVKEAQEIADANNFSYSDRVLAADLISQKETPKREGWKPKLSLGGSTTSSLTGGALKKLSDSSERLKSLSTGQRVKFEKIKRERGATAARMYLNRLEEQIRVATEMGKSLADIGLDDDE